MTTLHDLVPPFCLFVCLFVVCNQINFGHTSLADQLFGDPERHEEIRSEVVVYLLDHESEFREFQACEDEKRSFADYCRFMAKDGSWGGNLELQAACFLFRVHIMIHEVDSKVKVINNTLSAQSESAFWRAMRRLAGRKPAKHVPILHLSFHKGKHYNSVRFVEDLESEREDEKEKKSAAAAMVYRKDWKKGKRRNRGRAKKQLQTTSTTNNKQQQQPKKKKNLSPMNWDGPLVVEDQRLKRKVRLYLSAGLLVCVSGLLLLLVLRLTAT